MKNGPRIAFGVVNVLVAALVAWGVFRNLPTRWWVVDGGALVVVALLVASGFTLLTKHPLAEPVTRAAGFVVLALGLALFAALSLTASWLMGVYGPVGRGGAAIFFLIALLVLPYLVVYPAVLLGWIGPRPRREGAGAAATVATPETASAS